MKKWCAASSGPKSLPILAFCGAFEGSNQNSPDDVEMAMRGGMVESVVDDIQEVTREWYVSCDRTKIASDRRPRPGGRCVDAGGGRRCVPNRIAQDGSFSRGRMNRGGKNRHRGSPSFLAEQRMRPRSRATRGRATAGRDTGVERRATDMFAGACVE